VDAIDPVGLGCGWTSPWDCGSAAASKAASVAVSVAGSAIAVKNTVVGSAPAPFMSVASKAIPYGVRLGIGGAAAGVSQLVSDAGTSLTLGARLGRAAVAAGVGVVGVVVGVAVGGMCETGAIVFTVGAATPACVVLGAGVTLLTDHLLNQYLASAIDRALDWEPQRRAYACGA